MAERVSRKRRKSLQLQAERMRAAKARRSASVQETVESSGETTAEEPLPGPSGLNESVLLPAPDANDDSLTESESESSDDDYGSDFTLEDAGAAYQDWLATIDKSRNFWVSMRRRSDCGGEIFWPTKGSFLSTDEGHMLVTQY